MHKEGFDFSITSTTILPDKSTNTLLRCLYVAHLLFSFTTKPAFNGVTLWLQITHSPLQNHFAYSIHIDCTVQEQTGCVTGGTYAASDQSSSEHLVDPKQPPSSRCLCFAHTLSSLPSPHFSLPSELSVYRSALSKTLKLLKV